MCTSLHIVFVSLFTVVMVSVYLYCISKYTRAILARLQRDKELLLQELWQSKLISLGRICKICERQYQHSFADN